MLCVEEQGKVVGCLRRPPAAPFDRNGDGTYY